MFVIKDVVSFTASTAAATAAYSSAMNGAVYAVEIALTTKPLKAAAKLTMCVESSAGPGILTVAPTTVRTVYYPRRQIHGSTGAVLGSSAAPRVPVMLANERVKINIAAASSINHINEVINFYIT